MVEATLGTARFYSRSGPYSLAVVASVAPGVADELELLLEGVAPLQTARPNEVSFLDNRRCASALEQTSAGAVPSMVLMSRRSLLGHQETRRPRYPRGRFTSVTGRRCSRNGDLPSMKSAKSCRARSRGSLQGQSLSLRRLNRARASVRHWSSLERVAEGGRRAP